MRSYRTLYLEYAACHLKTLAHHRVDLIVGFTSSACVTIISITFVLALFQWVPHVKGWTLPEMLFMIGFANMARSIHLIFFDNFWLLGQNYIQNGRLDVLLVRPLSPLFLLISEKLNIDGLGFLAVGMALTLKSASMLGLELSLTGCLAMAFSVLGAGAIFAGLNLAAIAVSFWTMDSLGLAQSIHAVSEYGRYPLPIFGRGFEIVLTYILPYSFTAYYPCLVFLGKKEPLTLLTLPIAAAFVWLVALILWRKGLQRYGSTGS